LVASDCSNVIKEIQAGVSKEPALYNQQLDHFNEEVLSASGVCPRTTWGK
jgi:hypothetical protein